MSSNLAVLLEKVSNPNPKWDEDATILEFDIFNVKVCDDTTCDTYDLSLFNTDKITLDNSDCARRSKCGEILLDFETLEIFEWL